MTSLAACLLAGACVKKRTPFHLHEWLQSLICQHLTLSFSSNKPGGSFRVNRLIDGSSQSRTKPLKLATSNCSAAAAAAGYCELDYSMAIEG
jgi:hypothetical protein